jgi:hypothetical protein
MCNRYFNELDEYYKYANKVSEHVANVKYSRKKLIAASLDSTQLIMNVLDTAIRSYENDINMSTDLRRALLDINLYSEGYSFKSSYNTEFLRNFKTFMYDNIPFGIGNILYEIVYATRKLIIKPNVGRKVKKHVELGNDYILLNTKTLTKSYEEYLVTLSEEEKQIKETYLIFLIKLKEKPDSWGRYSRYDPVFVDNYSEMYYSKQMINSLLLATEKLDSAQIELTQLTRKRKKIKKQSSKLTDFYVEIEGIRISSGLLNRSNK